MNRLSVVMTIALVAHSLGFPHRELGHHRGSSSSDYQHGDIGGHGGHGSNHELSGGYGQGQGDSIGHGQGGSFGHGHEGHLGQGGLGHGQGGHLGQGGLGHGSSYGGSGSQHQQQYESGSHGGGSNLNVATGFSKTRVESIDSGSQSFGGGSSSGYQQNGGHDSGRLIGGLGGTHHSGGSGAGHSQFGSQSGGQKGFVVEESSGFTSVNKNQGGFQDNQRGSSIGSSGGHGSRY